MLRCRLAGMAVGPSLVLFRRLLSTKARQARGDGLLRYFDSFFPPQRQYLDQLRASLPKQEMIAQPTEAEPGLGARLPVRLSVLLPIAGSIPGQRREGQPPPTLPCPLLLAALPGGKRHFFL